MIYTMRNIKAYEFRRAYGYYRYTVMKNGIRITRHTEAVLLDLGYSFEDIYGEED